MLEAIQNPEFREAMLLSANAKYVEDQMLLQWHFYIRKRTRLFQYAQTNDRLPKEKKRTPGQNADEDGEGNDDGKSGDDNDDDDSPMEEDENDTSPVQEEPRQEDETENEDELENDENDETAGDPME